MSLHDVNKHQLDRSDPQPNHTDRLNDGSIKAHQTTSTTYKTDASATNVRVQQQNSRILAVDSNSIPVADFGLQGDGTIGLKVAKAGVDVTTATNAQLIFNSSQDIFKIANTVTGTLTLTFTTQSSGSSGTFTANSTSTLTLPHGLGIVPAISPQLFDSVNSIYVPVTNGSSVASPHIQVNGNGIVGLGFYTWRITADTTNVYISGIVAGGGGSSTTGYSIAGLTFGDYTFKVFCLQETAS